MKKINIYLILILFNYINLQERKIGNMTVDEFVKTVNSINLSENDYKAIIKRRSNLEKNNNKRIIKRNERNNQLYFGRKYPVTLYTSERRRFVDLDEFPENNCKINKQIQFESHLFSDEEHYYKTNEEIQKIQNRINQEKNNHNNLNILGQPIIRVNRLKRSMNTHCSMNNIHTKMKPTNMKWDSLQSQVMFSQDYTTNLYQKYGPKGPTAYQRRLHQFADSDNIDTLSGLEKNDVMNNFKYLQKPKNEEKQCKEEQKKIDEMIENIPNLSEGKKLEIKMKSSILDFKDDNELNNKIKDLNNFLLKEKNKIINDKEAENDDDFDKKYNDLIKSVRSHDKDKDIVEKLKKLNEVLKVIEGSCNDIRTHYRFDEEIEKLDRKEENEIENIYIDAQDEPDEDDEYEPEEDMVQEMATKEGRKTDYDSGIRPYSSVPSKPKRISISAKDKNY